MFAGGYCAASVVAEDLGITRWWSVPPRISRRQSTKACQFKRPIRPAPDRGRRRRFYAGQAESTAARIFELVAGDICRLRNRLKKRNIPQRRKTAMLLKVRGWDGNGVPKAEKLSGLGLARVAADISAG